MWASCRTYPQRYLPTVNSVLSTQPSTLSIPSEGRAKASSKQSPPPSVEAAIVISLPPRCIRPSSPLRSNVLVNKLAQTQAQFRAAASGSLALAIRRWSSKEARKLLGVQVVASNGCSFSRVGFPIKDHYPRFSGASFHHTFHSDSFGGFRLSVYRSRIRYGFSIPFYFEAETAVPRSTISRIWSRN